MNNIDGISKSIKRDGANNYAMSVIVGLFILGVVGLGRVAYTSMETITNTNIALSKTNSELSSTNISLTSTNRMLIDEDVRNLKDVKKTLDSTNSTVIVIEREVRELNRKMN